MVGGGGDGLDEDEGDGSDRNLGGRVSGSGAGRLESI